MQQYFVNDKLEINQLIKVDKEQKHHLINVMRMSDGSVVRVANNGEAFLAKLETIDGNLFFKLVEKLVEDHKLPVEVNLYVALIKNDKFDFMLQKVTELGVTRIIPLETKRCVVKIKDSDKKVIRWKKICVEASEQCKRLFVPEISDPINIKNISVSNVDLNVVAYEDLDNSVEFKNLIEKSRNINIVIGPEGGFEASEIALLKEKGFIVARLGKRILRAETASMVAVNTVSCVLE